MNRRPAVLSDIEHSQKPIPTTKNQIDKTAKNQHHPNKMPKRFECNFKDLVHIIYFLE
jgi:hypothetical protein